MRAVLGEAEYLPASYVERALGGRPASSIRPSADASRALAWRLCAASERGGRVVGFFPDPGHHGQRRPAHAAGREERPERRVLRYTACGIERTLVRREERRRIALNCAAKVEADLANASKSTSLLMPATTSCNLEHAPAVHRLDQGAQAAATGDYTLSTGRWSISRISSTFPLVSPGIRAVNVRVGAAAVP
jgi:hypothetical protein